MKQLDRLLEFTNFYHNFRLVSRQIWINGEERLENDSEHSFQLAFTAWYLISSLKLKDLDLGLVLKYAIAHDLVETYAGDVYCYTEDKILKNSKKEKEKMALNQIKKEFSEFGEMLSIIEKYEERKDNESKFIYALDKLIPEINIYLDGGRTWKRGKIKREEIDLYKTEKIKGNEFLLKYHKALMVKLKEEEEKIFN